MIVFGLKSGRCLLIKGILSPEGSIAVGSKRCSLARVREEGERKVGRRRPWMPRCCWRVLFVGLKVGQYFCDWAAAWFEEAAWRCWSRAYPQEVPRAISANIGDVGARAAGAV